MSLSNIKVNNSTVIGVDEQPTAESDNLVKSEGVFGANAHSFIHTKAYTATSIGFIEIPCAFHKGDSVIVRFGSGTSITDVYQRPTLGSPTGQQIANGKNTTDDGFEFLASIDFESIYAYFESAGNVTIERAPIVKKLDVDIDDLSENINSYLYPKTTRTLTAEHFHEIPCSFLTGDKVFIELSENTELGDIYQRSTIGSSTGQKYVSKVTTENGYYFIATIDFNSLYIWCSTAGDVTIKRDRIEKAVHTNDIENMCVTEEKLAFDLTPLKSYVEAIPSTTFEGVYPQYVAKILAGTYWGTNIFSVTGVSKVKITYRGAGSAYGIGFSTNGDTVASFNAGTRSDWWYSYPSSYGEIEINVPVGAKYLALAQKDMFNECSIYAFIDFSTELSGTYHNNYKDKTCIYIGDSISTENNYRWKGLLESEYGLKYVRGGSGLWPANGGITLRPPKTERQENELKSIWYRCAEQRMQDYNFDIISLFGGTNDMTNSNLPIGDVDADGNYADIADIVPYVDDASSFATPANYNDVWRSDLSFAECLKGCIEMLHRDFPTKPIMLCTVLPCGGNYGNWVYNKSGSPMDGVIMSERMAIVATRIAEYYFRQGWNIYAVPFYWGIRTITSIAAFTNWLTPEYGGGVDGVHPNRVCAIRMVDCVRESLMMLKVKP